MKKLLSLCLTLCLALSLFAGISVTAFAATDNAEYVYVYNTQGWKIYGYCYDADASSDLGGGWTDTPLDLAPEVGDYWYKYPVPKEAEGKNATIIIYNSSKQEDDRITFAVPSKGGKIYFNTYRNESYATAEAASSPENNCEKTFPTTGNTRVYFYNSERWAKVRAYCWGDDEYLGGWPGKYATKDEERENWYYIDINQDSGKFNFNVIFNNNNGGEQTESVPANKDELYVNLDGKSFASFEACEAVTPMAKTAEDFMMDISKLDTVPKTDSVTEYPSLTAPIVVLSIAGVAFVAVGAVVIVFTLRRKKNG